MDIEKYKQVISDAIKGEIEAKEFYEKVAKRIKDTYLKELFGKFANEELAMKKYTTLAQNCDDEKLKAVCPIGLLKN